MDRPKKGRAAKLFEAMDRLRLQDEGPARSAEPAVSGHSGLAEAAPPKPRGRAALLAQVQQLREMKVGAPLSFELKVKEEPSKTLEHPASQAEEVPPRSYKGSSGKPVNISANYIRLKTIRDFGIFEYHLSFDPPVDSRSIRSKMLKASLQKISTVHLYDGGSIVFLPKKLDEPKTYFSMAHPLDQTPTTITVTFIKEKRPKECLNVYNIIFKRVMIALLYSPLGRKYFSFQSKAVIPQHKLEIYPGYSVAVDEFEGGLMVCLDAQHRIVRSQNVLELLRDLKLAYKQDFKKAAFKRLIGASVMTRYNNKMYIIDEILWDANPQCTFETRDGSSISYIDYYKRQHDIEIKDRFQPMLLHRQKKVDAITLEKKDRMLCFVPELCFLTGLTEDSRSDFTLMKDIAQHMRISPHQRLEALRTYIRNVEGSEEAQKVLRDWGLVLDDATIDLQARVLDSETILFGRGVKEEHTRNANWDGALKRNSVMGPVDFKNWIVMFARRDEKIVKEFVEVMLGLGRGMGCQIHQPTLEMLSDDRTETYINRAKSIITSETQIVVFVCPTNRTDLYCAIKKLCCVHMPIASQVVTSFTLKKKQMRAITQKIALQMNCKLGGSLWALRFPFKSWMVCGIDVYHGKGRKSVCALISSTNEGLFNWHSSTAFQENEIGDHYKKLFANSLIQYRESRGDFPTNIIIYRDGLGIGQFDKCLKYEVAEFEAVLKQMGISAAITFIIVQKRINTRIFLRDSNSYTNPPPGTIDDHSITKRNLDDFFLVSQHVTQGTVTPTHYIVLKDTANIPADRLQRLTFKLCHLYYNWPGTIRVPAPCQYAHKLAYLVGENIGQQPHEMLNDKLYYL